MNTRIAAVAGVRPERWPTVCEVENHRSDEGIWCYVCHKGVDETPRVPPPYLEDNELAAALVTRLARFARLDYARVPPGMLPFTFGMRTDRGDFSGAGTTAPRAMCQAILNYERAAPRDQTLLGVRR